MGLDESNYASRNDGKALPDQQRGLIILLFKQAIETGNGDVIVHLAENYIDIEFNDVDLSVSNANAKYFDRHENLLFIGGYALDLLKQNLKAIWYLALQLLWLSYQRILKPTLVH